MNTARSIVTSTCLLALAAAAAFAGPLTPPGGAVGSSMKTLAEVEPRIAINATNTPGDADSLYRITQPGSYYLTGNLAGVSGKHGIEIASHNVTIDLCGFTLTGVSGSLRAIATDTAFTYERTVVTNGIVTSWPGGGVQVNNQSRLSGLTAVNNTTFGIRAGSNANIDSCTARSNAGSGIEAGSASLIQNCITSSNTTVGLAVSSSSRAERCVSTSNGDVGITVSNLSVAAWCTADNNGSNGFAVSDQSSVVDCSASTNADAGISASWGVMVLRCAALVNTGPGIRASNGCRVENNNCRNNGSGPGIQAGILVPVGASRVVVMNNTCTSNDYGIRVDGTFCLIKGNTVSSNSTSNFEIVANNRVATILTLPVSGAISGSAGGSSITDPDANYAY